MIDPKLLHWAASVLLILSGVSHLVGLNVQRSVNAGLRGFGALVSVASILVGILMLVGLLGVRI